MNRFPGASLRGGTPKNHKKMKTYITPNTEYTPIMLQGNLLSISQENQDVLNTTPQTGEDSPNAIGRRVF